MLKPIFLITVFLISAFIGQRSASRLSDRRDMLASFIVEISRASTLMASANLPIHRLFDGADGAACGILQAFSAALSERLDAKTAWHDAERWALGHDRRYAALQPTDRTLLKTWAEMLGRGFSAAQRQESEMTVAALRERLHEAQTACAAKSRIYRAIGALSGAAIAILLV